jgi:hypothetical protein
VAEEPRVTRLIRATWPKTRDEFIRVGDDFDYELPGFDFRLSGVQCSIYSEKIDAAVLRPRRYKKIVVNNTYLASFAYNLAIAWVFYGGEFERLKAGSGSNLEILLRYNLKKFFAEQILLRTNSVFGTAIFLETLLYDEEVMRPLFAAAKEDRKLQEKYDYFASLMSNILLFHEVGHLMYDARPDLESLIAAEMAELGVQAFTPDWGNQSGGARIEFLCDAFAVLIVSRTSAGSVDAAFTIRAIAFGFAMCACMFGLEKSAAATAERYPASADIDVLDEIHADLPGAGFVIGIDRGMVARARSALNVCEAIARGRGIDLFLAGGEFPLPADILEVMTEFATTVVDRKDMRSRGMCEMLARAFQGNDRGIEYLKFRSKVFKMPGAARQANDEGRASPPPD